MGLVYGVGVVVAQLMHNLCYPVVVVCSQSITDDGFESVGSLDQHTVEGSMLFGDGRLVNVIEEAPQPRRYG